MRDVKDEKLTSVVNFIPLLAIIVLILLLLSCTSTKEVVKTRTQIDSTAIRELSDSINLLKIENETLVSTINEMSYGVIRFDTVYLPGDTVRNTVVITKDGEVKASGNILSAYVSKTIFTKLLSEKQRVIDSLVSVKEKVRTEYKYVSDTKDKSKKTVMFPWYLLVIAAAAGVVFWLIRKSK